MSSGTSGGRGGGGEGDKKFGEHWNKKVGEYWRTHQSSPASRLLNPELHTKPNKVVAAVGTAAFVLILGNLVWTKYSHERALAKAKAPPRQQEQLEHIIRDDD